MGAIRFTNLTRAVEIGANSYLLEIDGKGVILDSGMHPKVDGELGLPNHSLVDDDSCDGIIVSHAHHDHIGTLPLLMRRQPRAPVFMTEATRQLSDVMLHNSVNVMTRRSEEGVTGPPLFTHREVDLCTKRWRPAPLHQSFDLTGERLRVGEAADVSIEFFDAGHILGSAGAMIRGGGRSIFYTGDVNFEDQTLMQGARFPSGKVDVLIMETTRGDYPTPPGFSRAAEERRLAETIQNAFARGGAVLLPLFALGKTQELLAMFFDFRRRGLLKRDCAIYIGGLSAKLTDIHDKLAHHVPRQHHDLQLREQVAPFVVGGQQAGELPLKPGRIYALSSGMMTENTISNTVAAQVLSDPKQTLIFVGYADPESPGGRIRAAKTGDLVQLSADMPPQPLRCAVETFNFSGHASRESLRDYAKRLAPKKIILVHGDPSAVEWFQQTLSAEMPGTDVITPAPGEPIDL